VQALQEEGGRLQEGAEALLGLVGEQQRDLSRDVIKPTVKAHMSEVGGRAGCSQAQQCFGWASDASLGRPL
jgi:hypothetical protein